MTSICKVAAKACHAPCRKDAVPTSLAFRPATSPADVLRIAMAQVLPKSLGMGDAGFVAALRAPGMHGPGELVDAVVLEQPVALAGMAGEHRGFALQDVRDVDVKAGGDAV